MLTSTTTEDRRIDLTDRLDPPNDFNFAHFRMRHMIAELIRTHHRLGIEPGREAPDFELPTTDGSTISPSSLRGQPVLLHFVSYTCPVTRGNAELMRNLHRRFGHRIHFLDVLVRQAHPGERHGRYLSFAEKLSDAGRYQDEESITWPVAVDDLDCSVQRAYGGLAASSYLLDSTGRVAHYALWGPTPRLAGTIERLLARDVTGSGADPVVDAVPHLAAAFVCGQGGPRRGGLRSLVDLECAIPGATVLMAAGRLIRPWARRSLEQPTASADPGRARRLLVVGVTAVALAAVCTRSTGRTPKENPR